MDYFYKMELTFTSSKGNLIQIISCNTGLDCEKHLNKPHNGICPECLNRAKYTLKVNNEIVDDVTYNQLKKLYDDRKAIQPNKN